MWPDEDDWPCGKEFLLVGGLLVAIVGLNVTLRDGLLAVPELERDGGLADESNGVFSAVVVVVAPSLGNAIASIYRR